MSYQQIHGNGKEHSSSTSSKKGRNETTKSVVKSDVIGGMRKYEMENLEKTTNIVVLPRRTGDDRDIPSDKEDEIQEAEDSSGILFEAAEEAELQYKNHALNDEDKEK